ncbi:hypothetical protein [Coleofasciculus sp.]|uniref:hypothetical protein n=2 Tax=Coleofasciculus sp. TaxID=3100458 RepID=UPI003A396E2B
MTEDDIQLQIDTANPDPQDTTYLQNLKPQLKQLSADSLIYDRLLRKMKDLFTTINININNYNETIERICARLGLDKEELSFWRYFGEETAPQFRGQIEANLSSRDRPWLPPHPFVIAFFASVICSAGAWWITKQLIQNGRSQRNS